MPHAANAGPGRPSRPPAGGVANGNGPHASANSPGGRSLRAAAASLGSFAFAIGLCGCLVGPDYQRPELELPQRYTFAGEASGAESTPDLDRWWTRFGDPLLDEFIAEAERSNLSLQQAVAVIEQYRAQFGIAGSRLYPDLSAGAGFSRTQMNDAMLGGDSLPNAFSAWTYGLDLATWEIDFFGKIRRAIEAAQGQYQASVEEWRNTLVTLRGEVASAYLTVRVLQQRRRMLEASIALSERQLAITQAQVKAGTVNAINLAEAQGRLAISQAELPILEAEIASQSNGLSVLLGQYPGEVAARLAEPRPVPRPIADLAAGVPAQILLDRPDVRAAERRMASEVARIGVATAGLYPEVTLSGTVAIFATDFSGLGSISNLTYRFGPAITWNFFTAGRTQAQIARQEAVAKGAEIAYRAVVLEAVSQVETAAGNVGFAQRMLDRLDEAVADAQRAVELAERQYGVGAINLSTLIRYRQVLLDLEQAQVQAQGLIAQNFVELCRSLGGGWRPAPLPAEADEAYAASTEGGSREGPAAAVGQTPTSEVAHATPSPSPIP